MARVAITSKNSAAIGPYSHGIDTGSLVFLSGQTPIDPATDALVDGDIGAQTRQCLDNLTAVLAAADLSRKNVIKCNVFLVNMNDFTEMNEAYASYFTEPFPSRTTVTAASLPLGA